MKYGIVGFGAAGCHAAHAFLGRAKAGERAGVPGRQRAMPLQAGLTAEFIDRMEATSHG